MKRLAITLGVLCFAVFTMFIEDDKKKKKRKKGKEFLEVETTGPNGEPVLQGSGGGKYYIKGDKKVYLRKAK